MTADGNAQTIGERLPVPHAQEARFWIGLACAALVHALFIVGAGRQAVRQMGEPGGSRDGVSVELIDAADLTSQNSVQMEQSTGAPNPSLAPMPPAPPRPKTAAAPPAPPAPQQQQEAARAVEPAPEQPASTPWAVDTQLPGLQPQHQPAPKHEPPPKSSTANEPPKAKAAPPSPKLSLQLDMPDIPLVPQGRQAAVTRPAGVTRSGENDDFGRGVIRALRQTMPSLRVTGRVTVRFLLSETGNLIEVRVVRSGGDPMLDQNVVFAVKQASFPLPPVGSTLIDRTFLVTYIYH